MKLSRQHFLKGIDVPYDQYNSPGVCYTVCKGHEAFGISKDKVNSSSIFFVKQLTEHGFSAVIASPCWVLALYNLFSSNAGNKLISLYVLGKDAYITTPVWIYCLIPFVM